MKKIVPLFLVFLLLAGCKVKNYTPEIPASFEQNAVVTSGDFSYSCRICKSEEEVVVSVTSTSAENMIMRYNGERLTFLYDDFSYDIDGSNFERENVAIVIYETFEYINNTQELNVRKIESGFKYEGKISCGEFILIQNDDNSFNSLALRNGELSIDFANE
ncbi:MAG: hypothetical protein PUE75_02275 [Eubacteriales bacterium]|nr:hypothetical protein [Eubacteriales bacterium]